MDQWQSSSRVGGAYSAVVVWEPMRLNITADTLMLGSVQHEARKLRLQAEPRTLGRVLLLEPLATDDCASLALNLVRSLQCLQPFET